MMAQYRCRLCKKKYYNGTIGSDKIAEREMYLLVTGNKASDPIAPLMTTVHHCKNGNIGLADFIGWAVYNE